MENKIEIGGRDSGKRVKRLIELDDNIRQGNFPILVLVKPQEAVIISLEEYKRLKEFKNTFCSVLDDIGFVNIELGSKEELVDLFTASLKKVLSDERYDNTYIGRENNEKRPKE